MVRYTPSGRGRRLAYLLALLSMLAASLGCAEADLFRWIDADGVAYYTTDRVSIPEPYRTTAAEVQHPAARPPSELVVEHPGPEGGPPPIGAAFEWPLQPGAPILVPAHLNGVALTLILDTGADRTMLSPEALARAGYGGEPGRPVEVQGVTGAAVATVLTVASMDVAGMQVGPLEVVAFPSPITGVDGLLGRDVLDAFVLMVDVSSARAILAPR
jgi:Aspartyl protease